MPDLCRREQDCSGGTAAIWRGSAAAGALGDVVFPNIGRFEAPALGFMGYWRNAAVVCDAADDGPTLASLGLRSVGLHLLVHPLGERAKRDCGSTKQRIFLAQLRQFREQADNCFAVGLISFLSAPSSASDCSTVGRGSPITIGLSWSRCHDIP
jgi:hypothetical protein